MKSHAHIRSAWGLHEGRPALAATGSAANAAHVLLDRPLADLDPQLEQLAADALGTPQPAARRHVTDQVDRLARQRRRRARPGSAPPEPLEPGAMPAQNGLGLDQDDDPPPRRQPPRAEDQLQPIDDTESGAPAATPQLVDL